MSEPTFNIGDKVIVVNEKSTYNTYENGDIGVVSGYDDCPTIAGYVTRTDGLEMNVYWGEVEHYDKFISYHQEKNKYSTVEATAWKFGDVEFIREGYNVNIFGAGEIQIPISTLKTILETLETN